MGIFDLFKKKELNPIEYTTENGILGPTFLEGLTEHIKNPEKLLSHEWRRKLRASSGQTRFKIKYYGALHEVYTNLIVGTAFAPALVVAVAIKTEQEILLFDGCKHGYDALFCDTYTDEQIKNRPTNNFYKDKHGNEIFEIIMSTYNDVDYEDEFREEVDKNGKIELINGTKIDFDTVKRNGYDTLQIWATNDSGETIDFVSEELA